MARRVSRVRVVVDECFGSKHAKDVTTRAQVEEISRGACVTLGAHGENDEAQFITKAIGVANYGRHHIEEEDEVGVDQRQIEFCDELIQATLLTDSE